MNHYVEGRLLIIGGAEDKKGECKILKRFIQEAGGRESRVVVLTAATEMPEQVGSEYKELFENLGAAEVQVLDIAERVSANRESISQELQKATGIFFTGGDQLRITGILGGTRLGRTLHNLYQRGVIIAGTSAGASAMSDTMIVGGEAGTPKKDTLTMAPGLGLLHSVVVDQHFAQRGRIGRLLSAIAQNPYVLGVGIDEDTSILVYSDGHFTVVGNQTVTVVDASPTMASNVSEISPGQALVLTPVLMHILSDGYRFDLKRRAASLSETLSGG
ncbi:cyanophycinase [Desulfitobacterium sp. LBE]|uniref:cyanophycinase n=1 Tax=Desulfitobacterium sp. LBE TaxID=884086 RepID=UPI001199A6DF|nr:cyanophycinase [Desulfitobacterium sp. LBE]TWH58931.1 cyanophycinase [Desulfitobacterium sp. LBE]